MAPRVSWGHDRAARASFVVSHRFLNHRQYSAGARIRANKRFGLPIMCLSILNLSKSSGLSTTQKTARECPSSWLLKKVDVTQSLSPRSSPAMEVLEPV